MQSRENPRSVLCLDIGSGTQDVLLYQPEREIENCPKFVLPSPAVAVAERIRRLTREGRPVHLHGSNMGGGFFRALKAHLEAGLAASARPEAAYSLGDDLSRVEEMGIRLTDHRPAGHVAVHLADYDPGFWRAFLSAAGLEPPDLVLACAQDHGFHPGESNRLGRFRLWRQFLTEFEGRPERLVYETPPEMLTRLRALQDAIGGGLVADTGAAAVLGALFEPEVEASARERGVCLVNCGNSHIIAFLLYDGRMWGVYEHHTGCLDGEALWRDLDRFRTGAMTNQAVFDAYGHGCMSLELPEAAQGFPATCVLGPRRALLKGFDARFLAPGGDMMLAGCFGLLKGLEYHRQTGY